MSVPAPAPVSVVSAVSVVSIAASSRSNNRVTADPAHSIVLLNPLGGPTGGGLASWMSWHHSRRP